MPDQMVPNQPEQDNFARTPVTSIVCHGRRRRCEVVRVQLCPDCQDVIDLASKTSHQCSLPLDI